MKKLFSVLLLLCICLTCAACGNNNTTPVETDSSSGDNGSSSGEPKVASIDMREQTGAEGLSEIFDYGDGFVGAIISKTVDGEKKTYLRFIDTNYGWLADGEYELGGSDFVYTIARGAEHYVCFESGTVSVSGDPRTSVNVQPIDFKFSYDRDDNQLYSPDGKWYAVRDDSDGKGDATLINIATGERITPYVGIHDGGFEDNTVSAPVGFAGDKFIFNIYGYEWLFGYGIYDLSTGETKVFDNQIDVGVFPSADHKTGRIPYYIDHTEIGYIDLADPGVKKPLYNAESPADADEAFRSVLDGTNYFYCASVAGGKYLGVIAEGPDNGMVFAAYDFETFEKVYEYKKDDYHNSYVFSGNAAVFMFESVDASNVTVITLP